MRLRIELLINMKIISNPESLPSNGITQILQSPLMAGVNTPC